MSDTKLPSMTDEEIARHRAMLPDDDWRCWDGSDRAIGGLIARIDALRAELAQANDDWGAAAQVSTLWVQLAADLRAELAQANDDWGAAAQQVSTMRGQLAAAKEEIERLKTQRDEARAFGVEAAMAAEISRLNLDLGGQIVALRAELAQAKAEVNRPKAIEAKHNWLCLAYLGEDGAWPCGCHHLITDSYGSRTLLTAADGEMHQECDDHSALRAEVEELRRTIDEEAGYREALEADLRAELAQAKESNVLTCAFCGEAYPDGTPATKHERLTAHVLICPVHPYAAERAARERAEARVRELEGLLTIYVHATQKEESRG